MKKLLTLSIIVLCFGCAKEGDVLSNQKSPVLVKKLPVAPAPDNLFTKQEVYTAAIDSLDRDGDFRWTDLKMICSGAAITQLIAVGYKPSYVEEDISENLHTINIYDPVWRNVHDSIIALVKSILRKENPNINESEFIYEDDPVLPIIIFKTGNKNVLTELFNLENVRYIEPNGFWPYPQNCSSSGCSASTTVVNTSDYSTILPSCQLPWNFNLLNIPNAWNYASGRGIKIGIIDAGISSTQSLLSSQFNSGYSAIGRSVTLEYTYGTSAFSTCTHGTSMSGLAVGPRNNLNAPTGVAYKSDLVFIRACDDVLLDGASELSGVKNALIRLGNNSSVRIISMSVGTPFYSSVLYDGVSYAYGNGKLIFAAAGTSFSLTSWWGVIYPAALWQCNAVTGVKENGNRCSNCHDGSEVRFTIPMERTVDNNRHTVTIPFTGTTPSYIGGSSCATAICAGIAAVVWSAKPTLTRSQVYDCMRMTAQYPVPVTNKGFGNPNAQAAVGMALTY